MISANIIADKLRAKKQKLAFAESCTGGLLSYRMVALAGVSDVYMGSIVAYDNQVKINQLDIPFQLIQSHGAVSSEVALKMSASVRIKLSSDWSVAITGIAGPSGGSPEKPVGTVWFAISGPQIEKAVCKNFSGDRQQIQNQSADFALEFLNQFLS